MHPTSPAAEPPRLRVAPGGGLWVTVDGVDRVDVVDGVDWVGGRTTRRMFVPRRFCCERESVLH